MMRRQSTALVFGLALGFASAAMAQSAAPSTPALPPTGMLKSGGLFLVNGDRAVFAVGANGVATFAAKGPAPAMADQNAPVDGLAPGQVAFALIRGSEGNTILLVGNHTAAPLRYQARIVGVREGKVLSAPTSTCPVGAGKSSFENWPQALPAVVILSIEPATPDDTVCR